MRRWARRPVGMVAVMAAAVLVGPAGTGYAQDGPADEADGPAADPEIAAAWNQYDAVAVAQGIGYQFSYDGESLKSGKDVRWGGTYSGSLPYSYAKMSDFRIEGIGSVYWPGYVVTAARDAAPLLGDSIPGVGATPRPVVDALIEFSKVAPDYPLAASSSGQLAERTAVPATEIPGGSVAAATMKCGSGAASMTCSGTLANVQLGAPTAASPAELDTFRRGLALARASLAAAVNRGGIASPATAASVGAAGEEPAAAVAIQSIDTVADGAVSKTEVTSRSTAVIEGVEILGTIRLGTVRAHGQNVANGSTSKAQRTVSVADASIGGQPVVIGNDGVSLAGNAAVKPADYDKANTQLRDALSAAGVTIRLFGGVRTEEEDGSKDQGEALYIGLKLPNPGVEGQFFYLKYWMGATINNARGALAETASSEAFDSSSMSPSSGPDGAGSYTAAGSDASGLPSGDRRLLETAPAVVPPALTAAGSGGELPSEGRTEDVVFSPIRRSGPVTADPTGRAAMGAALASVVAAALIKKKGSRRYRVH